MKFIPIYEALTIKAQKNSPPHIAFEEVLESERVSEEWARLAKIKPATLAVEKNSATPLFAKKVEVPEMVLTKRPETILTSMPAEEVADGSWVEQLPTTQARRLQEAQRRSEVLNQDWSVPTWSDMAREVLEKSGALATSPSSANVYVAGMSASGQVSTRPSQASVEVPSRHPQSLPDVPSEELPSFVEEKNLRHFIQGPLEITGGLAVTNEHHIEIRRNDEGVLKELGRVDLRQGLYNIEVENKTGTVVARLVDKEGKTLGEGSFRLNRVAAADAGTLQGPKLKIEPHPDFAGIITSAYNPKPNDVAPAQTRATFVKGASEVMVKKDDGLVAMDNVTKGSTTVMRAAAPKHLQTAAIVISGKEFKSQLYPETMIRALQDIVAQQRAQSSSEVPTIIWGKVTLDGKALAGAEVVVESDEALIPVYFNAFMIPDPQLKSTSDNGLFAFVDVTPGFHSLLATRSSAIIGYQNVVVEEGSVAQGDVESTIKSETVPLRIYDAFTGEARPGMVTMQSLQEDLEVATGVTTVSLPHISRLGLMRIQPEGADYVSARYIYNDTDEFIHAPLVHWSWLTSIKSFLRLDDMPSTGVVVGFVPDEDFEVYLAAHDDFAARQIVYFDMQGRILQNRKGIAGGGFILFNVPEDTHEVVVLGARTRKIYSRLLPVDANSLSILTFRE
ncbi:hypothetical protein [Bdellovibrio sp. ArHS]|uniref:hypothetical protein n=1 Tax=Bdellovibrio sp. ArHS TaxID=1569284 RepID=UPI000AE8787E|nr:hypothetical protein [Bdellovibrio sp. ArHS]